MKKLIKLLGIIAISFSLISCSAFKHKEAKKVQNNSPFTAKHLYQSAEIALTKGYYTDAVRQYEQIESQYPFGEYAQAVQLSIIYAYYKSGDKASAVAAADRYIHLYPRNPNVEYAYYMRGVANFEQERGVLAKYLPLDIAWRAPGTSRQSYEDFKTLTRRFPKSKYLADAHKRMVYLRNMFAQHELNIAKFYMKRQDYVAAANRANTIIENYSTSPQVKQALVVLANANHGLHLNKEAQNADAVYARNYGAH